MMSLDMLLEHAFPLVNPRAAIMWAGKADVFPLVDQDVGFEIAIDIEGKVAIWESAGEGRKSFVVPNVTLEVMLTCAEMSAVGFRAGKSWHF